MKIGIGAAFALAVVLHGALLAVLAVNVSLDKPKKPEEKTGQLIHATIVNMPPAKGHEDGKKEQITRPQVQDTAKEAAEAAAKAAAEAAAKAELEKQVEAQKKAEAERQKALALKKKAEEEAKKKAEEEAKRKAAEEAKRKAEEEAKKKAEEAKRKAAEEAKRKAEEEAKRKAAEEAKRKAAEEAKKQAEAEAKRKAEEAAKMQAAADALEDDILGKVDGVAGGQGLGSGNGSNDSAIYGGKVQQLIEQNWRIDPSMNGKRVVVTLSVNPDGTIYNEKCEGDSAVCGSALSTLRLIGLMPMPPKGCKDCNTIVITMTPKI